MSSDEYSALVEVERRIGPLRSLAEYHAWCKHYTDAQAAGANAIAAATQAYKQIQKERDI